jgi:hypothetical protein
MRALGGPAHFVFADGEVAANPRYAAVAEVEVVAPGELPLLGVPTDLPIYRARRGAQACSTLPRPELVERAGQSSDCVRPFPGAARDRRRPRLR